MENVCLAVHEDYGLYAVGSKSHTSLMDARTIQCVRKILSKYSGYGIRSTNFYSSLLSIGTGQGTVMFYDLRAGKYLESNVNSARSATLKSSSGWTYPDEEIIMDVYRTKYTPAIYTHCVDMSGTRIFAAGGPLPITLCGNYIGLYHWYLVIITLSTKYLGVKFCVSVNLLSSILFLSSCTVVNSFQWLFLST